MKEKCHDETLPDWFNFTDSDDDMASEMDVGEDNESDFFDDIEALDISDQSDF